MSADYGRRRVEEILLRQARSHVEEEEYFISIMVGEVLDKARVRLAEAKAEVARLEALG